MGVAVWLVLAAVDRIVGLKNRPRGLATFLFLGLYFSCRFLVEFVKEEQADQLVGKGTTLTMGQRLSIPLVAIGWAGLAWVLLFGRSSRTPADSSTPPEKPAPAPRPPKKQGKKQKRG
jgi:prolipoprotein diacylglyceryltransferase